MQQECLFNKDNKKKYLENIDISKLYHSKFNPRLTRPEGDINSLGERISRNGFEITRALWVYPDDETYAVFAGGTRLEASKQVGLKEVPCIIHEGFIGDEIVRLSELDNENDEYHKSVNMVDIWHSYKALADQGWTQERIAKAKGISRNFVSYRLSLAELPEKVKDYFVNKVILNERHALELLKLSTVDNRSKWLSKETAMAEIIESVLKNKDDKITAKIFAKEVSKYNKLFELAECKYNELTGNYRNVFIEALSQNKVRSIAAIETQYSKILEIIENNINTEKARIEAENKANQEAQKKIEKEKIAQAKRDYIISRIKHGDFRQEMEALDDNSVSLIFTDPPYLSDDIDLYGDLASLASRKLKEGGSLIAYCGHYAMPKILNLMGEHLRYWWLIAMVHGGKTAKLEGKRVFVGWKPLVWFVKNTLNLDDGEYVQDIIKSNQPDKALHEWQQDILEAEYYIKHLTNEGDLVVDPFVGSGTTLASAQLLNRLYWGCEIDKDHCDSARARLLDHSIPS